MERHRTNFLMRKSELISLWSFYIAELMKPRKMLTCTAYFENAVCLEQLPRSLMILSWCYMKQLALHKDELTHFLLLCLAPYRCQDCDKKNSARQQNWRHKRLPICGRKSSCCSFCQSSTSLSPIKAILLIIKPAMSSVFVRNLLEYNGMISIASK